MNIVNTETARIKSMIHNFINFAGDTTIHDK